MRLLRICWLLAVLCQLPYPVTPTFSKEEAIQQVESNLMSLFGFKKKPKIDKSKIIIPEAMIKEYERQSGQKFDSVNINRPGLLTQSANTMRSFVHHESNLDLKFPGHHNFRLHFDITSIPKEEVLKTAELVLNRDTINWLSDLEKDAPEHFQTITISDILKPGKKGQSKASTRIIDVKRIDTRKSGSVSFNVQPAVLRWRESPQQNFGLLVQISGHGGNKTLPARHVRIRRDISDDPSTWSKQQPVLFTYTDDQKYKPLTGRDFLERKIRKRAIGKKKKPKSKCKRHSMYVDFVDVGWANWIVAPPGYDAFYCSGECSLPLTEHMNTTNHAIVQALINDANPSEGVPKACCVPTHLTSISMLYVDDGNKVVLKNYKEMTIQGCGCR